MTFPRPPHMNYGAVLAALAIGATALSGCSDSPTDPEEHHEPAGFAIELDGTEVLRYLDGGALATLELTSGTVYEAVVVLLDEDGDPLPNDDHEGDEEELQVTIGNPAILTWQAEDQHDHQGDHLEFHGELAALGVGNTQIQLCLLHINHCDYQSPSIPVAID